MILFTDATKEAMRRISSAPKTSEQPTGQPMKRDPFWLSYLHINTDKNT
jgi:hypothetical protein